jgi:hypothetical protein
MVDSRVTVSPDATAAARPGRTAELLAHIPDPQRGLIGPRAHDVEVEVDGTDRIGWLSRHAASGITAAPECPCTTRPRWPSSCLAQLIRISARPAGCGHHAWPRSPCSHILSWRVGGRCLPSSRPWRTLLPRSHRPARESSRAGVSRETSWTDCGARVLRNDVAARVRRKRTGPLEHGFSLARTRSRPGLTGRVGRSRSVSIGTERLRYPVWAEQATVTSPPRRG